jgi:hypothetical protein
MKIIDPKGATQSAHPKISPATFEAVRQNFYSPTSRLTSTPAPTETSSSLNTGQFINKNSTVVIAFVISFSVLAAGIVGFGKRKYSRSILTILFFIP